MALEREIDAYSRLLPELLAKGLTGKFALVLGEDLIGVYGTHGEALTAGYGRTLTESFLVKKIVANETPEHFSRSITPCRS